MSTVRQFVHDVYRLINASNPTIPLHGDDEELAIRVLNQLLHFYAATGLLLTIAKTVSVTINSPINEIWFTDANFSTVSTTTEIVTLTNASPSFSVIDSSIYFVGDLVTGGGIPPLASIISIVGNIITISANATMSGLSSLTFSHDISDPMVVYIKEGRLANLDNSWLQLSGLDYPLQDKSRDEFLSSWKFEPLKGLPQFIITFPETKYVRAQLYPAPSQFFTFNCRGKFQLSSVTSNDTLDFLPDYYELFFLYAVARFVAPRKGRAAAWTEDYERTYRELKDVMESASEVNLSVVGDREQLLNGHWRVQAGI
jgi:hypothetical protein